MAGNSLTRNDETDISPTTFQLFNKNQRELKKNLIINATRKLIEKKPINHISIRDIVKEVGISPASLYSYFKSREVLFIEIFLIDIINIDMLLKNDLSDTSMSPEALVTNNLYRVIEYIMGSEAFIHMLSIFLTEKNLPDPVSEKISELKENVADSLAKMMQLIGIQNPDVPTSNAFLSSVLGMAIICWNNSNQGLAAETVSAEEIIKKTIRMFTKLSPQNPISI